MNTSGHSAAQRAESTWHLAPGAPAEHLLFSRPVCYIGEGTEAFTDLDVHDLVAHRRHFGARPHAVGAAGDALIDALDAMALSGRGGGHFPAARKWRAVRHAGGRAVVVANGAEGEPLSRKDAALLELRPHLVLDGLACAAEAMAATDTVIWLHEGADTVHATVRRALAERRAAGVVEPPMRVAVGPNAYLTGESTAVVNALSEGVALPRFMRTPTAVAGVDGRPTLVQNVETLARVALAARGDSTTAATTVLTVAGSRHSVVLEVDSRCTIGDAVRAALGDQEVHAVLLGGYGGAWCRWEDVAHHAVDDRQLRAHGLSIGAGVVLTLAPSDCGITRAAQIADFMARSSARQCGPCVFGLRAVSDLMTELADRAARRRDVPRLQRFLGEITGRGACHHPDGAVRMVSTAITAFAPDVQAHLKGRCLHTPRRDRGHRHG